VINGYSHIGVATQNMEATIYFYEGLLGFARVAEQRYKIKEGGEMRLVYFDVGNGQFIVFMEPTGISRVPTHFDTGINDALGVPRGIYHFAFKALSLEELSSRQKALSACDVEVSSIVDHGYAQSIFFRDPNGIELEYCFQSRPFEASDLEQEQDVSMVLPD
jgi:glyoxylase I family protein